MQFIKRAITIDATQWHKNGDHPLDDCHLVEEPNDSFPSEGKVVRRFNSPHRSGTARCHLCGASMRHHGWIDTLEGGHIVCPNDWIITGVQGEHYPCKPDIFEKTYEQVVRELTEV